MRPWCGSSATVHRFVERSGMAPEATPEKQTCSNHGSFEARLRLAQSQRGLDLVFRTALCAAVLCTSSGERPANLSSTFEWCSKKAWQRSECGVASRSIGRDPCDGGKRVAFPALFLLRRTALYSRFVPGPRFSASQCGQQTEPRSSTRCRSVHFSQTVATVPRPMVSARA